MRDIFITLICPDSLIWICVDVHWYWWWRALPRVLHGGEEFLGWKVKQVCPIPGSPPKLLIVPCWVLDIDRRWISNKVHPALPSLHYTFSVLKSVLFPSHLQHPSVHPCSPCFILHPCIPVSFISVPMSLWSSHRLHIVRGTTVVKSISIGMVCAS